MRRPSQNAKQRHYARVQRALRALQKASVRYTNAVDGEDQADFVIAGFRETELHAAAMKFANTLETRERRRLSK